MSDGFVSCDWGTSNLRLRWVDAREERLLGGVSSGEGVKQGYDRWLEHRGDRTRVYYEILARAVARLEEQLGRPLPGAPLIVSGMASSSIGIAELPYATLPFPLLGDTLGYRVLEAPLAADGGWCSSPGSGPATT